MKPKGDISIDKAEALKFLKEIVAIKCEPSIGIYEREIAQYYKRKMEEIGFEVELLEAVGGRPSVIGSLKGEGGGKSIIFNGHLMCPSSNLDDWHFKPYGCEEIEGRLYGVGAADMKAAIAAMILAAAALKRSGIRRGGDMVIALGAGGEAGGIIGTKYMVERGLRADCAIVGEPTELEIVFTQRGAVWMELFTKGRTGLTGVPGGVNAVHKMAALVNKLTELNKELNKRTHPLLGTAEISVNVIQGGTEFYNIPDRCRAKVDRRLVAGERTKEAIAEVEQAIGSARQEDPQLQVEMKVALAFEPAETPVDSPVVRLAREVIEEVRGRAPELRGIFGYTEAVHLIEAGIPTIICGPGSTKVIHAPDEYVHLSQYLDAIKVYALIAQRVVK